MQLRSPTKLFFFTLFLSLSLPLTHTHTYTHMMPTDYPVRICAAGLCVWSHRFVCVCMYMWTKKRAVWGLTTRKSPVSVIYCSLVKFNGQKRGLLCQAIRSGKGIWNHSINGTEKGSGKLYYGKPRLV